MSIKHERRTRGALRVLPGALRHLPVRVNSHSSEVFESRLQGSGGQDAMGSYRQATKMREKTT